MTTMVLPYQEPLVPREPGPRQIPEPLRAASPEARPVGSAPGRRPRRSGQTTTGRCTRRSAAAFPAPSGLRAASTSTRSPTCPTSSRPTSAGSPHGSSTRSSRSARSRGSTSIAGATAARTSTSGSCRGRSACSRHAGWRFRCGKTPSRTCPTRSLPTRRNASRHRCDLYRIVDPGGIATVRVGVRCRQAARRFAARSSRAFRTAPRSSRRSGCRSRRW